MYRTTNCYHNSIVLCEMVGPKYYCCVQLFLSHICSFIFIIFYFALLISVTIFNLFILLLFFSSSVYKSSCLHYLSCHSIFHLYVLSSFKMFCFPLFWLEHLHYQWMNISIQFILSILLHTHISKSTIFSYLSLSQSAFWIHIALHSIHNTSFISFSFPDTYCYKIVSFSFY